MEEVSRRQENEEGLLSDRKSTKRSAILFHDSKVKGYSLLLLASHVIHRAENS